MKSIVLTLMLSVAACDPAPSQAPAPAPTTIDHASETLSLAATRDHDTFLVDLAYRRRVDQAAPRMVELHVRYGAGLDYVAAEPGAATTDAGKQLVVQDQHGDLRVLVFATGNQTLIASGALARLTFRDNGKDGVGAHTLTLAPELPIFAPAAANDGLLLGAPLDLGADLATGGL